MIQVVAFDLDDTLWAVHPVIMRAEGRLGAWLEIEVPHLRYNVSSMREFRQEVLDENPNIGYRLTEFRQRVIEKSMLKSDIPRAESAVLAEAAMEVFLTARNEVEFFDGALEAIAIAAKKYQLGALTNGNADIGRLGLADHFSFAFSAEQVGAPKPAPDLFHTALDHTGCDPVEMVYVGDDPQKDIDAANEVGLHTIWLKNAQRPGPGETSPDKIIENISQLPAALKELDAQL